MSKSLLTLVLLWFSPLALAKVLIISEDITQDMRLKASDRPIVVSEVHVRSGVHVTLEDGITLGILNGEQKGGKLQRAALIFDSGSRLTGERIEVIAVDQNFRPSRLADNGGLWFLGTGRASEKDEITAPKLKGPLQRSDFRAKTLITRFLGHTDPLIQDPKNDDSGDDIDGLSLLSLISREWNIDNVESIASGDDGFDITQSSIQLQSLRISRPTEDGLNLSSSDLLIQEHCGILMGRSGPLADRELFDLEVDDGPSFVILGPMSQVDLEGYFGDEIRLMSRDLPQPTPSDLYSFFGQLGPQASSIYSRWED